MGLFDSFKRNSSAAPAAATAKNPDTQELDFMSAIEAHVRWKVRLENYIEGKCEEKLDPEIVCQDNQCILGKWIYGAGQKYKDNPLFDEIRVVHTEFHKGAAQIIRMSDAGEKTAAMDMVQRGDHYKNSQRIKSKLARLHIELKGGEE